VGGTPQDIAAESDERHAVLREERGQRSGRAAERCGLLRREPAGEDARVEGEEPADDRALSLGEAESPKRPRIVAPQDVDQRHPRLEGRDVGRGPQPPGGGGHHFDPQAGEVGRRKRRIHDAGERIPLLEQHERRRIDPGREDRLEEANREGVELGHRSPVILMRAIGDRL